MLHKILYTSNLTHYDLIHALKHDSIAARDTIEEVLKEDKELYTASELKKQRYFKLTLEEFTL